MIVSTLGLDQKYCSLLKERFPDLPLRHAELSGLTAGELRETEILFTYGYDMKPELLSKMDALRWVHIGQSGMDTVPLRLLREKKVFLTNSRGINSVAIAEYVLCALLNITRKTFLFRDAALRGQWDTETHIDELEGKTLGIFGLGMAGREVAKRAKAFGMNVLGVANTRNPVYGVDEVFLPGERLSLLPRCDFVVLCLPLTDSTLGIIAAPELHELPTSAWLINVGRGALVNTSDLIDALTEQRIAGAVLDVFETEPLPDDSALWRMENVWISPHIAGDRQPSYMPKMMRILCDNLSRYSDFEKMENPVSLPSDP